MSLTVTRRTSILATAISLAILIVTAAKAEGRHPEWRGLLANPGFDGRPVKGIYFFPGEGDANQTLYTTHPTLGADMSWNSNPGTRSFVMTRLALTNANTVVMSYWGTMKQWSPMILDQTSVPGVLDGVLGVQRHHLVIMPALESGSDSKHPELPQWDFPTIFPHSNNGGVAVAPGLLDKIGELVALFHDHMDLWAQLYDREGKPRYAINIIHASSSTMQQLLGTDADDKQFATAFDAIAFYAEVKYRILVGFTLDTIGGAPYSATPKEAGAVFEKTSSILAIQGFESEVFSRMTHSGDNNADNNIARMADWKRDATRDWVATGVPVILDVSNGFDGRKVWAQVPGGPGWWGDNMKYTDDRWRNWMSELKGPGIKGIVFDTWNGYTEGYAAAPSEEHGTVVYDWLRDAFDAPPWDCTHVHYVNGARTHKVYGAICMKWKELGADRGFGAPTSEEQPTLGNTGRVSHFADGKSIFWSGATQAHEVHGLIGLAYEQAGEDKSCLGLPVSDEKSDGGVGRVTYFQTGKIIWKPGDNLGHIIC
jgi:hypothetical protein